MTDRRQVLQMAVLAGAVVALPACGDNTESAPQPQATADAAQLTELTLIAAYDAAITTAGPKKAAVYQRIRDEHAAHLQALGWDGDLLPANADAVDRARLIRAERSAARTHTTGARDSEDAETAQILALIAASEAQHAVELRAL